MRTGQDIKRDLAKVLVRALFALFLIPAIVWVFSHYVLASRDAQFLGDAEQSIRAGKQSEQDQQSLIEFYRANPPSTICDSSVGQLAEYRESVCESRSFQWQLFWAERIATISMTIGGLLLLAVGLLGLLAFRSSKAQYRSLIAGWRLLSVASALEVVVQSAMVVWLSFWLTAYFFEFYSIKLVAIIGICAGLAALAAVVQIFERSDDAMQLDGELVGEEDAPALWARIRDLAAQMGTAPPDNIIAGIDANFFVTESAMTVQGRVLGGRSLYVSLPLLRVLDQREADAVLVHELEHLRGGDTASSAALGPKLVQFDRYCAAMSANMLTLIAFYLLNLYRIIFELALKRYSREREFVADKAAATVVGGNSLVRALIKVAAYSTYRNRVEHELFARRSTHDQGVGIADFVAQGLQPFAHSSEFLESMETARIPHPFDSHPLLDERMNNVESVVPQSEFGEVIAAPVVITWISRMASASEIEARLWAEYEARFAQAHEQDLAYRFLPDGDTERAVVEKYFPAQVFILTDDQLTVAYDGLTIPADKRFIHWDEVTNIEYEDGLGCDILKLTMTQEGVSGSKAVKVKLPGVDDQRDALKSVLGGYWHRHKVARAQA